MDPVLNSHYEYTAKRYDLSCGQMRGLERFDFGIESAMLYCLKYRKSCLLSNEQNIFALLKSMEQECMLHMQS